MSRQLVAVLFLFLQVFLITSCSDPAEEPQSQVPSVPEAPVGQLDDSVVPKAYRLELTIDPRETSFSGRTEIDVNIAGETSHIWLHGQNLEVSSVTVQQEGASITGAYEQNLPSGVSLVTLGKPVNAGAATLAIEYTAPFNDSSNALYSVQRGEHHYAATQFEPIAARQVFPSFDEPRFKIPFDITILARTGDAVITTTPEVSASAEGEFTRHVFKRTTPLPTYLLAFVVGPYDVVTYDDIPPNNIRRRAVPLRGVAAKGQGEKLEYALSRTADMLMILEDYFGSPYPYKKLDIIATPAGFGGAMENVGAIIYDEYLLLLDESSSLNQKRAFVSTHAHELAHMWFGNLVTPDWWTDIWLNEAFATWISYKISDLYWPEGEFDRATQKGALGAMANDSLSTAREVREIVSHNDAIMDSFDGITYQKGGGVLGMIERYAGEENFRNGIRHHMARFTDQVANAPDFMESLAQGAELAEIEPIFASFISQSGVPLIELHTSCGAETRVTLTQSRYAPLGSSIDRDGTDWQVPVCTSVMTDGITTENCFLLDQKQKSFSTGGDCPTYVHPNSSGSGYYRFSMTEKGWRDLIDNTEHLGGGEALSMLDSLDAGFRAGNVSVETYIQGMAALINHPEWHVPDKVTEIFEQLTSIISAEHLPIIEQAFRDIVGPRFEQSQTRSTQSDELLYEGLLRFMIVMAKESSLREPMAEQAARYIGLDQEADRKAIAPGQLETVLSVGVQDLGEPFFDKLLEQAIASEQPAFRGAALGALARVEDPALVKKLQDVILAGQLKGTEVTNVVFRQMARIKTTQLTYEWMKAQPAAVIEMIPQTFRSGIVPAFGSFFCSREQIAEWQQILKEHEELIPGYERTMSQVIESNDLCAGLKEQSETALLDYLKSA